MSRAWAIVLLGALVGCSADAMDLAPGARCPDNANTIALSVTPGQVDRGASVTLRVEWALELPLGDGATATLQLGEPTVIDVTLPLTAQVASGPLYAGELPNPFGALAPAGDVVVLADSGPLADCRTRATATTSFALR